MFEMETESGAQVRASVWPRGGHRIVFIMPGLPIPRAPHPLFGTPSLAPIMDGETRVGAWGMAKRSCISKPGPYMTIRASISAAGQVGYSS